MEVQGRKPDGSVATIALDKNTNTSVISAGSQHEIAVLAGNVFTAGNQAARAWSVALNTTHTGLVLTNPVNSGKNYVILKASFALTVAPLAIASIGLFTGFSSAGVTVHTTPLTYTNCLVGGAIGTALVDEAATLVGTPVWALQMMGGFTAGALPSTTPNIIDVNGAIVIKPGGYCGIGALTAVTGFGTIIWEEKNI